MRGEDGLDHVIVIYIMRKVEEDGGGADVGVFNRVDPCKVLVFDKDRAMGLGNRVKSNWALEVLAG